MPLSPGVAVSIFHIWDEIEKQRDISAEEQIEAALEGLSYEDREAVRDLLNRQEWVKKQEDYRDNALLVKDDPTNQRVLYLDYYISDSDGDRVSALLDAYVAYVNNGVVIDDIADELYVDVERRYAYEAISAGTVGLGVTNADIGIRNTYNGDAHSAIIEVRLILPEDADAETAEMLVTGSIKDYTKNLTTKIGTHEINLIRMKEGSIYNQNVYVLYDDKEVVRCHIQT